MIARPDRTRAILILPLGLSIEEFSTNQKLAHRPDEGCPSIKEIDQDRKRAWVQVIQAGSIAEFRAMEGRAERNAAASCEARHSPQGRPVQNAAPVGIVIPEAIQHHPARPGHGIGGDHDIAGQDHAHAARAPFTLREIASVKIQPGAHIVSCTDALAMLAEKHKSITALIADALDRKRRIEALMAELEASKKAQLAAAE